MRVGVLLAHRSEMRRSNAIETTVARWRGT
jgi:hypothetical protein